jgi:5-methylcytosine-specific restriction endonuclease McrA
MCFFYLERKTILIDKGFIKNYLIPININYIGMIDRMDVIDRELLLILHEGRKQKDKIKSLFKKYNDYKTNYYIVERTCENCAKIFKNKVCKTNLWRIISNPNRSNYWRGKLLCPKCGNKERDMEYNKKIERDKEWKELQIKNTQAFIELYLDPNKYWRKDLSINSKYYDINNAFDKCCLEELSVYIKNMNYYDFLETPYWKAVSLKKLKQAGFRCQLCNEKGKLAVHHRNYNIRGHEHENLNELIVLCYKCHKIHHKIDEE